MRTSYIIELYDKTGDELIRYYEVPNVSMDDFKEIFGAANEIELYGCAPIKAEHLNKLRKFTTEVFELDKYDYFMSLCSFEDR